MLIKTGRHSRQMRGGTTVMRTRLTVNAKRPIVGIQSEPLRIPICSIVIVSAPLMQQPRRPRRNLPK
jgi:hypothetical protein